MRRALLAVGLLGVTGCAPVGSPPEEPRLVVLYATCTLNRDTIAPYAEVSYTPNLDAFARESVVFRNHQSESGQSGIAFASIFSGTQADVHGIYNHPTRLKDELYLVTEAFRDAGYDPWFFSGQVMASHDLNYGQGVPEDQVFVASPPRKREKVWSFLQPGNPLTEKLLERLRADPEYRAFVLCNFTVTHGKYHRQIPRAEYDAFLARYPEHAAGLSREDLEEAWAFYDEHRFELQWGYRDLVQRLGKTPEEMERFTRAIDVTYRADVAYLDRMFGATLELLRGEGLLEESAIAFTADHGETFNRPETLFKWTHGLQLAPEVLSVPWLLRAPGRGLVVGDYPGTTRSIDVFPTLAGVCGIDLEGRGVLGTDLSGVLRGEDDPPDLLALSHTTKVGAHRVKDFSTWAETRRFFATDDVERIWVRARSGDGVVKWRNLGDDVWGVEVFDLASDPGEALNLHDPKDPEQAQLVELLKAYKARLEAGFRGEDADVPADALERLQSLGYVEGG